MISARMLTAISSGVSALISTPIGEWIRSRSASEAPPSTSLALVLAQPLGLLLQERITTSGEPGSLRVVEIIPRKRGRVKAHRIVTEG